MWVADWSLKGQTITGSQSNDMSLFLEDHDIERLY